MIGRGPRARPARGPRPLSGPCTSASSSSTGVLPYLLVAPQLLITLVFFIWPAGQALFQSVLLEDAFGLSTRFVWLENFERLFGDPNYLNAVAGDGHLRGVDGHRGDEPGPPASPRWRTACSRARRATGRSCISPYAVAPAVAGVLWLFMFNPVVGIVAYFLRGLGYTWNHQLNGGQALFLVIIAAAWKQISYNFLFFLAGLQAIPHSVIEAAAVDGAGPASRFWRIVFPLLSPTTFFLVVVNVVYAFIDTFGIIHTVTSGGPAKATETLVYKVFNDGFIGLDFGRLGRAVGRPDGDRHRADRGAVPLHRAPGPVLRRGRAPAGLDVRHPRRADPGHPRGGLPRVRDPGRLDAHRGRPRGQGAALVRRPLPRELPDRPRHRHAGGRPDPGRCHALEQPRHGGGRRGRQDRDLDPVRLRDRLLPLPASAWRASGRSS